MIGFVKKSLKAQVWLLYSVIFMAIIVSAVVLLNSWSQNNMKVKESQVRVEESVEIAQIIANHVNWMTQLNNSLISGAEFSGSIDPTTCSYAKWLSNLSNDLRNDAVIAGSIATIGEPHHYIHTEAGKIVELSLSNPDAAYNAFTAEILPRFLIIVKELTSITIRCNELAAESTAESSVTMRSNSIIQLALIVVVLLVSVAIGLAIGKLAINPAIKVTRAAEKLAGGDLNTNIDIKSQNEIGRMAMALNNAIGLFKSIIKDIDIVMKELSTGNLLITTSSNYIGDFSDIEMSVTLLIDRMGEVMSSVINAAEQVASGAGLVSDSSMTLSQGATEQASSVQQLTASLEEIASQTSINAQNAQTANDAAQHVKGNAEAGNAQMKEMLKAMDGINEASSNINKIIKVIDDIAFQTNILALNAAVEAARAGQHGKGFAVVAEEVRTLAARSAQAAKETTSLIEGSISKVEAGTKIANETSNALSKIGVDVASAADLIELIAIASNEQAVAMKQVNQGVTQISSVVQSNAASSEESAAASEELSSQADQLKKIVSTFKVKGFDPKIANKPYEQTKSTEYINKHVSLPGRTISLESEYEKYYK